MGCLCDPTDHELAPLSKAQQKELFFGDNSFNSSKPIKKKRYNDVESNEQTPETREEVATEGELTYVPPNRTREDIGRYASYDSAMVVMEVDSPMNTSEFPQDEKQVLSNQLFLLINKIDETLDQRESALILNSFTATPDLKRSIC